MFGALGCVRHELPVWVTIWDLTFAPKSVPTPNPQNDLLVLKDENDISVATAALVIIGNR